MTYDPALDDAYRDHARRRTDLRDVAVRRTAERYRYGNRTNWTLGVDPASTFATIVRVRRDDRGGAGYVEPTTEIETEERTTVTTATEPTPALTLRTVPAFEPTAEPAPPTTAELDLAAVGPLLTMAGFRELGPCGPYIRAFGEHFPESRFPNGVAICEDVCGRHAADFDWGWAASQMLSHDGLIEYQRLRDSRARAVRERFGPSGETRRARIFGHLFATAPSNRSSAGVRALRTAEERVDERALHALDLGRRELNSARRYLADARQTVTYWEAELAQREAALPALEAACAGADARRAARAVVEAERDVAVAEAALETTRVALEAARAEAARHEPPTPEAVAPTDALPSTDATDAGPGGAP